MPAQFPNFYYTGGSTIIKYFQLEKYDVIMQVSYYKRNISKFLAALVLGKVLTSVGTSFPGVRTGFAAKVKCFFGDHLTCSPFLEQSTIFDKA